MRPYSVVVFFLIGGHPRNWRRMYGILSETIQNFIAEIAAPSQLKPSSNDEAPRQATEDEERKNVGSVFNPTMTLNFWKTLLVRNPLFIAHPDAAMRTACASSQLIIWTVEGRRVTFVNTAFALSSMKLLFISRSVWHCCRGSA